MGVKKSLIYVVVLVLTINIVLADPPSSEFTSDGNTMGLWHFNEGNGNTTQDFSSHGNNGNISGATWVSDGRFSNALVYDRVDDSVRVPDHSSLDITGDFTLEAWVKPDVGYGSEQEGHIDIVSKWGNTGPEAAYLLSVNSNGYIGVWTYNGQNSANVISTTIIPVNVWSHIAGVLDGTTLRIYINGALNNYDDNNVIPQNGNVPLFFGEEPVGGNNFNGTIDESRVSNVVRYPDILGFKIAQVVENVDLVKGKTTLVRANVTSAPNDQVNLHVYLNNLLMSISDTVTLDSNGQGTVDVFFVPDIAGSSLEIKGTVVSQLTGFNASRSSGNVNVKETKELDLFFVPVTDIGQTSYNSAVSYNANFIQDIFPLRNGGLSTSDQGNYNFIEAPSSLSTNEIIRNIQLQNIRFKILSRMYLAEQSPTNVIGIIPENYLDKPGLRITGINYDLGKADIILADTTQVKTTAHEVGHTLGFCEEYSADDWREQNSRISGGCANGDEEAPFGELDDSCLNNPIGSGCPTNTLLPIYSKYGTISDQLRNFMGGTDIPTLSQTPIGNFETWISDGSYNALLSRFDINSNYNIPKITKVNHLGDYIIVRLFYYENGTVENNLYYSLQNGFIENLTESIGNYSIEIRDNLNNLISSFNFEPNFYIYEEGGNITKTEITSLVFALPTNENATSIQFKNTTMLLNEVNRTPNMPVIKLKYPFAGTSVMESTTIEWEASDADNDTLYHSLILNKQDGDNLTIGLDLNETSFVFNFSTVPEEKDYSLTLLTTDGFNTATTESSTFCVNSNLSVCGLNLLATNQTTALFEFVVTNILNNTQEDINWTLDTGDSNIITSTSNFNLTNYEDIFIYIEYTYGSSGNYVVTAKSSNMNFTDTQSINITI